MDSNNVHVINSEENVISLGGIFDFLLKKWKTIIVVCVIGLVVGVGLAFMPEKIDVEMKNVNEDKVNVFHGYNELLEKDLLKQQEDIIVNFNPEMTYVGKQDYHIEASLEEIQLIFDYFMQIMNDNLFWSEIDSVYDNKYDIDDLRNLVGMWHSIESDDSGRVIGSVEELSKISKRGTLSVSVTGNSEENCNKMLDIVEKYILAMEEHVIDDFSSYNRRSVLEKVAKSKDTVENRKADLLRETESLVSKVASLKKDLTNDEKTLYYKVLYPEEEEEKTLMSYLKMPVLMTFLAAFLICFIYVMKYIFNHQIKTASELDDMFGLHVFGVYKASENKKGFDGVLQRREAKKDLVENSKEYIVTSVKELNKSPVILIGNKNNNVISTFMEDLKNLSGDLSSYGELQSDPEAISVAHKQNGIILVINLWNTTADEINREIEIAIAQNINVLGCIVVK